MNMLWLKYIKAYQLMSMVFFATTVCNAQKQANYWYFGQNAGLSFASGNPVALLDGKVNTIEGVATISDSIGNLLFYTDGITVYNKLHQVMQNGTGLFGHKSATQSAVIVPQPGNDSIFYIFTVEAAADIKGINYSVVNMRLNNNVGAIIKKNITMLQRVSEKITAIRHCNNNDIWIIARQYATDKYYTWLVKDTGIVINSPVISACGNVVGYYNVGFPFAGASIGYLKASPDGKKIAAAFSAGSNGIELSNFDNATGVISNTLKIAQRPPYAQALAGLSYPYGIEFSPNSKLLYFTVGTVNIFPSSVHSINQFDITSHDSAIIAQSHYFVDTNYIEKGALQLANNGKIYATNYDVSYLSVLNNPNIRGVGCNFIRNGVSLNGKLSSNGLPTFIQSYFSPSFAGYSIIESNNCTSLNTSFILNSYNDIDSVKWNFGNPLSGVNNTSTINTPTHTFTANGNYTITAVLYKSTPCITRTDTLSKTIWVGPLQVNIGADTSICKNDTILIKASIIGATNIWSNNSIDTFIKVTVPGIYWVKLTKGTCVVTDSIQISTINLPQFSLGLDTIICTNTNIILRPNAIFTNAQYLWNTNATSPQIFTSTAGNYWLKITNQQGCVFRDTINISFKTLPNFTLGADTSICTKDSLLLKANVIGASNYIWNTGATKQSIYVKQAGNFWCAVTKDGCIYTDSINILFKPLPIAQLGADTTLCAGVTKTLQSPNIGATYTWQDGSSNQIYTVNKAGLYHIVVTKNSCIAKDSIQISYIDKPQFTLGSSRFICPTENVILSPTVQPSWQLQWQNNSNAKTYTVTQPGLYYLNATNICGTNRQQIQITEGLCKIYIPSAFSPNNDGKNDVFKIAGTSLVSNFHLQIFNRFGQKVFETTDKFKGWNGQYNNQPAESSTYIYLLQYKDNRTGEQKLHKGSILLLR